MSFKDRFLINKKKLLADRTIIKYNRDLFKKFFEWEEEKLKRINGISQLDESTFKTLEAYIHKLRNVNSWFQNKPWNKLTDKDIKKVYNDLEDGIIINRSGSKFEDRRSYYNKIFKAKPFKLAGLHEKAKTALEFFTDKKKKQVKFITENSFKQLLSFLHKPQHFVLFWLAWDIGENITSLLELKVKNLKKQMNRETKEEFYLVYLAEYSLKRSRHSRSEPTLYPETVRYIDALMSYGREIEYRDEEGKIRRKTIPYNANDFLFTFKYRQALQIFDSVVKRSGVKCEPDGEKASWKDLRSGMACHLFSQGWHVEDINLRLGHSPQSKWLDAYINYLAVNRKRVISKHYNNNLEDLKYELEESKRREKLLSLKLDKNKKEVDELKVSIDGKDHGGAISTLLKQQKQMAEMLQDITGKKFDIIF